MDLIKDIVDILRKDWKLLAAVNVYYFGILLLGGLVALLRPDIQGYWLDVLAMGLKTGTLAPVGTAIEAGQVLNLALQIFRTNLINGTLVYITIPGLAFPPWAPIIGGWRALLWGMAFVVPYGNLTFGKLVFHYLTMLIEGEAYIIAIFACLRQIEALLWPSRFGESSRVTAYVRAIIDNFKLLIVVALILAVGAVYEALELLFVLMQP
ncbi:MAG: hypothetical protein A4E28_01413 [Methanocella sp. PtaU1.Bin125]|nr:MAG: hypothetical protein A4E28_01413 [Methanocella sp. PtaU1.Bin125]